MRGFRPPDGEPYALLLLFLAHNYPTHYTALDDSRFYIRDEDDAQAHYSVYNEARAALRDWSFDQTPALPSDRGACLILF